MSEDGLQTKELMLLFEILSSELQQHNCILFYHEVKLALGRFSFSGGQNQNFGERNH